VAEPSLPPVPPSRIGAWWDARSPRIPYVAPPNLDGIGPQATHPAESIPQAAPPALVPPAPAPVAPSFVLEFSTGERVTVTGSGLIGRAPERAEDARGQLQLVRIDDPGRSVSKTHLRFDIDDDGLWIVDNRSGNGTAVESPGHALVALRPGERHRVASGAVVRIGQQSFAVRQPPR
jgi:hypothetical protein